MKSVSYVPIFLYSKVLSSNFKKVYLSYKLHEVNFKLLVKYGLHWTNINQIKFYQHISHFISLASTTFH